jgi:hypothetical protein
LYKIKSVSLQNTA